MGLLFYGFRSMRGVVTYNPESEGLPDGPLPLYHTDREVQEVIDRVNAKRGIGNLTVVEYEVQPRGRT